MTAPHKRLGAAPLQPGGPRRASPAWSRMSRRMPEPPAARVGLPCSPPLCRRALAAGGALHLRGVRHAGGGAG